MLKLHYYIIVVYYFTIFAKRRAMKYDYITKYDHLKEGLNRNGFVLKNKNHFSREADDCILSIDFVHSVPMPKVRDYNIMISVKYPKAVYVGHELDVSTVGIIGANIGYLSPLNTYKVWRVADIDEENLILTIIDDMLIYIENYALPFLKKYSILENTIHEIEVANRLFTPGSDYNLPIFYLLNNDKKNALSFLKRELAKKESRAHKAYDDCPIPNKISIDEKSSPSYRALNEYKEFAKKIIDNWERLSKVR